MGICFSKPKVTDLSLTREVKEDDSENKPRARRQNVRLSVVAAAGPENNIEELPESAKTVAVESIKSNIETSRPKIEFRVKVEGELPNGHQQGFEDKKQKIEGISDISEITPLGIGFACKKGLKPDQFNQDDFSIIVDPDFKFFGVFDGHGSYGHRISNYVHSQLPELIISHPSFSINPQEAISDSFQKVNQCLFSQCLRLESNFDCKFSGTTATTAFIMNNHLIISHVGDSRAVLGVKKDNICEARRITTDHKANVPSEMERIISNDGVVKKLPDDFPYRIFVKGKEYPGLSTSRAIGDSVAQTVGVIPIPEIHDLEITEDFEFLLMCSDGVWEFLSDQEAINIVKKYEKNTQLAAMKLASSAWSKWIEHEESVVDDITVIVVHL
ncbi:unnamed protein product [Blepharisma stoltei]|uniref:PPM-type phosphatase domain-containing protein n=1 Tax=Blepharisma stoltei TaxID=1481888 RepID=A0AAU9JEQ9_9CILI|nr:unnamed protein product [Blepharisma stoltei]